MTFSTVTKSKKDQHIYIYTCDSHHNQICSQLPARKKWEKWEKDDRAKIKDIPCCMNYEWHLPLDQPLWCHILCTRCYTTQIPYFPQSQASWSYNLKTKNQKQCFKIEIWRKMMKEITKKKRKRWDFVYLECSCDIQLLDQNSKDTKCHQDLVIKQ